ncbi:hypothetical protein ACQEVB_22940 [Pseudonocardia sp. CA-107938]|uniref:hypothetical protein n=1 Tax=Pseudonocardia sp. CA-107938 TaxID=3240021 RepID=UPI003D8B5AF9
MLDKPDHPARPDDPGADRADLARAVARQRVGRNRIVLAVVAFTAAVVTAACGTANAATPGTGRVDTAGVVQKGGHAGHGSPSADEQDGDDDGDKNDGNKDDADKKDGNDEGKENGKDDGKDKDDKDKDGDKGGKPNNGLDVLGRNCDNSDLPEHTGFQVAPACVDTAFGEVAGADKSPALLITEAPREVKVGEAFTLKVSTRNLVRDRFLGAAAGGYYLESSFLDKNGIQRGHFHTACRMLPSLDEAPDSSPDPDFFLATQDNKGGAGTDTVDVEVTGLSKKGTAQCTSWAGDGSHRIPMMQRANQTPAVDSVRITVK